MGMRVCATCGQVRAKPGTDECPVCYLVRVLAEEHEAGEHQERFNPSCVDCTRSDDLSPSDDTSENVQTRDKRSQTSRRGSHALCTHDATPAARRACRRRREKRDSGHS